VIVRISRGLREDAVPDFLRSSVRGRADVVQIREPELGALELLQLVNRVVAVARTASIRVVVNDRTDVALMAGADGVHLRADGPPVAAVRTIVPSGFLIGRSAHSDEEIDRAAGADYLIFGTVFPTGSKPGVEGQGLDALRRAVERFRGPVLAIGGVTSANADAVLATGAAGYAGISAFDL
jgi:thiamine-phosphate diphosphorylase